MRALNENAVPRIMQLLVPFAEFTSGAVSQSFYSLLRPPLGVNKSPMHESRLFRFPVAAVNVDHVSVFAQVFPLPSFNIR